jgi:hypothetical protein
MRAATAYCVTKQRARRKRAASIGLKRIGVAAKV